MAKKTPPIIDYKPDLNNAHVRSKEQTLSEPMPHDEIEKLVATTKRLATGDNDLLDAAFDGDKKAQIDCLDLLADGFSFYAPILEALMRGVREEELTLQQAFSLNSNSKGRPLKKTTPKAQERAKRINELIQEELSSSECYKIVAAEFGVRLSTVEREHQKLKKQSGKK